MALEALRGYLQLAGGLTEVTRQRATTVARAMVASGGQVAGGLLPDPLRATVATMADDLVATGRANRELLVGLVRGEIDRAVDRLGLVTAHELEALARELTHVQTRLSRLEAAAAAAPTAPAKPAKRATAAKKAAARRRPAQAAAKTTEAAAEAAATQRGAAS